MFLTLPREITTNIFSHLDFTDKINLKTTCRELNERITKAVLHENVSLFRMEKYLEHSKDEQSRRLDTILQNLIDNQFDGSFVKVLSIDITSLSIHRMDELSNIFPNVNRVITSKEAKSNYSIGHRYIYKSERNRHALEKWRNTIEKMVCTDDWYTLIDDVFFSKYPRLTELDIGRLGYALNSGVDNNGSFSFFKNAPLLTTLTLRHAVINFVILEALHTGFPHLTSLRFFKPSIILKEVSSALPLSIIPANKVSYLVFFDVNGVNMNDKFLVLDYIRKKYTNLQQLEYGILSTHDYFLQTRKEISLYYSLGEDELEEAFLAQQSRYFSCLTLEDSFFSNLPKSLKRLTLNINNIDHAVAALAESDTKISMLDLLDRGRLINEKRTWKYPTMLGCFNRLTSLKTLRISLDSSIQTFHSEFISSSITRLCIGLVGGPFSIEWALAKFPSLEELYINPTHSDIHVPSDSNFGDHSDDDIRGRSGDDQDIYSSKQYPRLRILSIRKRSVHQSLFDFIKTALPNLDELNLDILLHSPKKKETISKFDLSGCCLNKCNITFYYHRKNSDNMHCMITIQNTFKRFLVNDKGKIILPAHCDDVMYRESVGVEVVLDSIKHLTIFDYPIIHIGDRIAIDLIE